MLVMLRIASEINLKSSQVRRGFLKKLEINITAALESQGEAPEFENTGGRIFVNIERAESIRVLSRVFGLCSYSVIEHVCEPSMEAMVELATKHYANVVAGKSFAVRTNRSVPKNFSSMDVERTIGAALRPFANSVNLKAPDVTVYLEIRAHAAYFFSEKVECSLGLPLGVQGRSLALISGGFDSAVAAWFMMKRGVDLDFLFCNFGGAAYEQSVLRVVKLLHDQWAYGSKPRLFVADFSKVVADIKQSCNLRYGQVLLKRMMLRAAENLAKQIRAQTLVTGEAIGQVSSQTLTNIRTVDAAVNIPILRPLIGFDKTEIIELSRKIGTYTLCESIQEHCNISERHPVTSAALSETEKQESSLDMKLWSESLESMKVHYLNEATSSPLDSEHLFTEELPKDGILIDCRETHQFARWHYPKSINVPVAELMKTFTKLDKSKTYVLYCAFGMESVVAAERMQAQGFLAYSYAGGSEKLRTKSCT